MTKHSPFRYIKTSPEIICLAVVLYVRFRCYSVTWKIFCTNEPLRSAMKQFDFGGIDLVRCSQKFAAVHSSVHNNFNQERHFYSRDNFKLNCSAALTEWRHLCSAYVPACGSNLKPVRIRLTVPFQQLLLSKEWISRTERVNLLHQLKRRKE